MSELYLQCEVGNENYFFLRSSAVVTIKNEFEITPIPAQTENNLLGIVPHSGEICPAYDPALFFPGLEVEDPGEGTLVFVELSEANISFKVSRVRGNTSLETVEKQVEVEPEPAEEETKVENRVRIAGDKRELTVDNIETSVNALAREL